ncbi:lytic transglycosylase domain-containing protein [Helcococcus ovis]|uniref:Lytic transglycosylase domain-containing protein n=4 Tax=Helcococcus ovis TaxID=72026 RepID=A0A4R9C2T3_9FIRM|nr:lytic transglycosylase domain-containing protein [Helcococcus ovis]TFF64624.1 lytic transglycosylase domain-containing protein [Helcococcus ovis]TFF66904.1 lytic transglycosylase domain-containing protein [Helcococcus ovis]TFF67469.1 lytic transglycosylase domain-containing protein [Helcococcus ovis]WNZ01757.1 lytic transglycosylase domain-containing protein [Helcococcus ovis]
MKVLKRLIIILIILALIIFSGIYFYVYLMINDNHVPYIKYIEKYSEQYKIDKKLVTAVVKVESSFNEKAHSHANAKGLMQLLPETGEWIANRLGEGFKEENLLNPELNIKYGTYYLKYLFDLFKNVDYAIMAYNGGPSNVQKWIDAGILNGNDKNYDKIPIAETKHYIYKVKKQYNLNKKIYDVYYKNNTESKFKKAFKILISLG